MIKKVVLSTVLMLTMLDAYSVESEIGINVGVVSTKNEIGSSFTNPTIGVTLQYNNYVVMPRLDLEYVKLKDEQASSLLKGSINGVYEFENSTNIVPYVLAGVGYENVGGGTKDVFESHPFVQAGGGLSIALINEFNAQFEGKMLQILAGGNEENEAVITAGITIPIDARESKRTLPRAAVPSFPPIVRPVYTPQPRIVYVNNNECSIKTNLPDLDRDGIEDSRDQCPATPCNFSVDGYGCPIKTRLQIKFANNSSEMEGYSLSKIHQFAKFLLINKGSFVSIVGHTDSVGSKRSNLLLSQRRARAVVHALILRGVSPARLQADGKGEGSPIASNTTKEGRAKNRRIEAKLTYRKGRK